MASFTSTEVACAQTLRVQGSLERKASMVLACVRSPARCASQLKRNAGGGMQPLAAGVQNTPCGEERGVWGALPCQGTLQQHQVPASMQLFDL